MRRAAGSTLRMVALGGWAVLALAALPAAPGSALAAGGQGHGATDGPARPHEHAQKPHTDGGGPRGEGHHVHAEDEPGDGAEAPAPAPAPTTPRIEIADALGPITGVQVPGEAFHAAAGVGRASSAELRMPLLSFDAPSPFAPRSLAGDLRDAPGAAAVHVAIRRGGPRHGCGWWTARRARFSSARRESCSNPRWLTATLRRSAGGARLRWRVALGGALPNGSYRFVIRVLDARGRRVAFLQT